MFSVNRNTKKNMLLLDKIHTVFAAALKKNLNASRHSDLDDSRIQRIVLATEDTTVTKQVSHRPIKCQYRLGCTSLHGRKAERLRAHLQRFQTFAFSKIEKRNARKLDNHLCVFDTSMILRFTCGTALPRGRADVEIINRPINQERRSFQCPLSVQILM